MRRGLPEVVCLLCLIAAGAAHRAQPRAVAAEPSARADPSLLLSLPLDGNAADAGPLHIGTEPHGLKPAADRRGRSDGAVEFDGSAWLRVDNAPQLNHLQQFTLSAWVNPSLRREHLNVISKVTPWRDFNLQIDARGLPVTHIMNGRYEFCYAQQPIPVGEWSLLTASFSDRQWSLYINGQLSNQVRVDNTPGWQGEQLVVGALQWGGAEPFAGRMDDLRIYGRAVSAQEAASLYTIGQPVEVD